MQAQTILRVDGDQGSVTGDGSDWGLLAFKFPQDALDFIIQNPGPYEVWVAATVETNPYRPDRCATCGPGGIPGASGDPTASFSLINNVGIYGGFLGTDHLVAPETQLSQSDPEANETILSGFIFQPEEGHPPCDGNAGDCHLPNGTPGCNDEDCCDLVCASNPACCSVEWVQTCADLADALCPTSAYHVVTADGVDDSVGLEESVTLMGFSGVADYQAHISATSEGEAFLCACVLQVLLEAQP
ncbi:MAG: hypothetical protein O7D91_12350 [Planctomycetota bacterium]|nr:hypothetical protein [Planctomycetota bacterium]